MSSKTIKARLISKHDTTSKWNAAVGFIPRNGEIIVYTDHRRKVVNGETVYIPGVKIGSGNAYVQDLAFIDDALADELLEHIGDTGVHVSSEDRERWNAAGGGDWNESDSTSSDYIKNRTHYTYLTPATISQPKIGFSGTPGTTASALKALDFWLYGTDDHFVFDYETSIYVVFRLPGYYLANDTQKRDIQLRLQIGSGVIYGGQAGTSTSLMMPMGDFISGNAFVHTSPINFGAYEFGDNEYYPIAYDVEAVVKLDAKYLPSNIVGKLNIDDNNEVANETLIFNRD